MIKLINLLNEIQVVTPGLKVYASVPESDLFKLESFSKEKLIDVLEIVYKYYDNSIEPSYYIDNPDRIKFDGDFLKSLPKAYLYISGDGSLYFVDSLSKFSEGSQTEEDWGVQSWELLRK